MKEPGCSTPRAISIVCSLGLFLAGYIFYTSAILEPFYTADFSLTSWQIGLAQAGVPLGAMAGAMLAGWLADLLGRRRLLVLCFLLLTVLGLLNGLVFNYYSLCVLRIMNGCLAGTLYPLCAAYLTEMTPPASLARQSAILMFVNCMAAPIGCVLAFLLFSLFTDQTGWRLLAVCHAFPAFYAYWLVKKLPESSAWLHKGEKTKDSGKRFVNIKTLFNPMHRNITFCLIGAWFLMDIAYYGVNFFIPYLLQSMQIHSSPEGGGVNLQGTFIISLFFALGAFAAIFIVEKMNLVKLQKYGFLLASLSLFLLANYFYLGLHQTTIIIFLFVLFNFALNAGPDVTTYLLSATSYPVEIRGSGHGLVAGCAKLGSVIGVLFLPKLQVVWGYEAVIVTLSILLFGAYLLTRYFAKLMRKEGPVVEGEMSYETH